MSSIQIQYKSSNIVHTNYIHVLHIVLRNEKIKKVWPTVWVKNGNGKFSRLLCYMTYLILVVLLLVVVKIDWGTHTHIKGSVPVN